MKILLLVLAVAFSAASAQDASKKVIKDPNEYNAYITALNTTDPAAKAVLMEGFLEHYPSSVVRVDAMEQAMAAYQVSGNTSKVEQWAKSIIAAQPENVRALAIVTTVDRAKGTQGDAAALKSLAANAERGLKGLEHWKKPDSMSDSDFAKLVDQMSAVFNGAAGFDALQKKEYDKAIASYRKSVAIDPTNLQDTYQLSVAELQKSPEDPDGFWHAAHAMQLAGANAGARDSIEKYAKARYQHYHGSQDGWDKIVQDAAASAEPPVGFAASIKKAQTPEDLAVQAVRDNKPEDLSFSDKEFILSKRDASPANKDAAKKVWDSLMALQKHGKAKLSIPAKVISAEKGIVHVAVSDDNQQSGKADLVLKLRNAKAALPKAGDQGHAIGVLTGYVASPFVFRMTGTWSAK